jgi:hypothetical protein
MEVEPQSPAPQKHVRAIVDPKRARSNPGKAQLCFAASTSLVHQGIMETLPNFAPKLVDYCGCPCRRSEQEPESEGECIDGKFVGSHTGNCSADVVFTDWMQPAEMQPLHTFAGDPDSRHRDGTKWLGIAVHADAPTRRLLPGGGRRGGGRQAACGSGNTHLPGR